MVTKASQQTDMAVVNKAVLLLVLGAVACRATDPESRFKN